MYIGKKSEMIEKEKDYIRGIYTPFKDNNMEIGNVTPILDEKKKPRKRKLLKESMKIFIIISYFYTFSQLVILMKKERKRNNLLMERKVIKKREREVGKTQRERIHLLRKKRTKKVKHS